MRVVKKEQGAQDYLIAISDNQWQRHRGLDEPIDRNLWRTYKQCACAISLCSVELCKSLLHPTVALVDDEDVVIDRFTIDIEPDETLRELQYLVAKTKLDATEDYQLEDLTRLEAAVEEALVQLNVSRTKARARSGEV